ncbi:MAG: hypothetical protein QOH67_5006 [Hyphomicrobiales bacterium]|jgi:hypothetical protein|nr:hypothetical protein [Hyphomicrobiales bacterium]
MLRFSDLVRGAVVSVGTAACFFALFVAAALWIPQDQQTIRRHIVAAIVDGTYNARFGYGPFGGIVWPRHTLDCGLSAMMIAPSVGRLVDAMSNRIPAVNPSWRDSRVPETLDCQAFARAVPELGPGYGDVQFVSIDRYIMGARVFARAMLSIMPLGAAADVMRGIAFALLGALAFAALRILRNRNADDATRRMAAGYVVIAACLALLYGVQFFDAMLVFAPPDFIHFIFILISLILPLANMRPVRLALYAASYGSLTAIFEALTGQIPFALAMLPLLLALGFAGDWRSYFAKLIQIWACFCIAVIVCFAIKKVFTVMFIEDQDSFLFFLLYRMYGEVPAATGVSLSLPYLLSVYRRWSGLIALGSPNIGTGLVLASLTLFAVQTFRMRHSLWTSTGPILVACWLGIGALLAWCVVFLNHTAVHPYHMARLLVIPVVGAAVLLTTQLMQQARSKRLPLS